MQQANPRENVTGSFPWAPEEQFVLQHWWANNDNGNVEWRDVPIHDAEKLYTVTDKGLPVPNSIREPGVVRGDFFQRMRELGFEHCGDPCDE